MTLLLIAFVFLMFLSFGVFAFFMRPTQEQKALQRRVVGIKATRGDFDEVSSDLDEYLTRQPSGSFQWLERLVRNSNFSPRMQNLITQADSKTSVGTVMMTSIGLLFGVSLVVYIIVQTALIALVAGVAAAMIPTLLLKFRRSRRLAAFDAVLADSIDMMTRSLRAGHSMNAAIGIVADQAVEPAKSEFDEVFKKQNYGLPLRDGLMQMLERVPSQDLRVLITAILVQKDTGGNLAEILDRTVAVIRERVRIQGEIRTHTAQGRMTGWILCALPIVMMILINIVNPGYSRVLIDNPVGRKLLYGGIALLTVGGLLIRQIINGIEV